MHTINSAGVSDLQIFSNPSAIGHGVLRKGVTLKHAVHSDAGLMRLKNQDAWKIGCDNRLFALADGIGGRRAGEIASQNAVVGLCQTMESAQAKLKSMTFQQTSTFLQNAIQQINNQIFQMGCRNDQHQGMGTTICCLYQYKRIAIYAHVGDSRLYLIRNGHVIQLTQDHTFKQLKNRQGSAAHEKNSNCLRTILTRAIGVKHCVSPTLGVCPLVEGDRLILCSDGLSDALSKNEINQILTQSSLSQRIVRQLIDRAKNNGSRDNITAILIEVNNQGEGNLF